MIIERSIYIQLLSSFYPDDRWKLVAPEVGYDLVEELIERWMERMRETVRINRSVKGKRKAWLLQDGTRRPFNPILRSIRFDLLKQYHPELNDHEVLVEQCINGVFHWMIAQCPIRGDGWNIVSDEQCRLYLIRIDEV